MRNISHRKSCQTANVSFQRLQPANWSDYESGLTHITSKSWRGPVCYCFQPSGGRVCVVSLVSGALITNLKRHGNIMQYVTVCEIWCNGNSLWCFVGLCATLQPWYLHENMLCLGAVSCHVAFDWHYCWSWHGMSLSGHTSKSITTCAVQDVCMGSIAKSYWRSERCPPSPLHGWVMQEFPIQIKSGVWKAMEN